MKTLSREMIRSGGLFLLSIVIAYFFYTSISLFPFIRKGKTKALWK